MQLLSLISKQTSSLIHAFEYLYRYSQIYAITMCQDPEVNMNILVLKDGVILM